MGLQGGSDSLLEGIYQEGLWKSVHNLTQDRQLQFKTPKYKSELCNSDAPQKLLTTNICDSDRSLFIRNEVKFITPATQ